MKKPSMLPVFATILSPLTSSWPGFKQAANWLMKEDIFFQTMLPGARAPSSLESGAERLKFVFNEKTGDEAYAEFLASIGNDRHRWPANLNGLDTLIRKTVIDRQARMTDVVLDRVQDAYRDSSREYRDLLCEMIAERIVGNGRETARDAMLMTFAEIELADRANVRSTLSESV